MTGLFSDCKGLREVDFSGLNTEFVTDMSNLFSGCNYLDSINLESLITKNVTNMSYMFSDCSRLEDVEYKLLDTGSVMEAVGMFQNCINLRKVDLSDWDLSCMKDMSEMFQGCSGLITITLPDLSEVDYSGIEAENIFDHTSWEDYTVQGIFDKNSPLMDLGSADFRNVEKYEELGNRATVCGNQALTRAEIGRIIFTDTLVNMGDENWDISSFSDGSICAWTLKNGEMLDLYIGANGRIPTGKNCRGMLAYFSNVTEIVGLENVDFSSAKDVGSMFEGCNRVRKLELSGIITEKTENIQRMFKDCYELEELNLSDFNTLYVKSMCEIFRNCMKLEKLDLSEINTNSMRDMDYAFCNCSSLREIIFSNGFSTLNVTSMKGMFKDCGVLEELDISSFSVAKVRDMSEMFSGCSQLKNLDLSGFWTASIEKQENMFDGTPWEGKRLQEVVEEQQSAKPQMEQTRHGSSVPNIYHYMDTVNS